MEHGQKRRIHLLDELSATTGESSKTAGRGTAIGTRGRKAETIEGPVKSVLYGRDDLDSTGGSFVEVLSRYSSWLRESTSAQVPACCTRG